MEGIEEDEEIIVRPEAIENMSEDQIKRIDHLYKIQS